MVHPSYAWRKFLLILVRIPGHGMEEREWISVAAGDYFITISVFNTLTSLTGDKVTVTGSGTTPQPSSFLTLSISHRHRVVNGAPSYPHCPRTSITFSVNDTSGNQSSATRHTAPLMPRRFMERKRHSRNFLPAETITSSS